MAQPPPAVKPEVEHLQVRLEMLVRGFKVQDLARLAGVKPRVLTNVLCGQNRSWPIREKVNRALGKNLYTRAEPQSPATKASNETTPPHD